MQPFRIRHADRVVSSFLLAVLLVVVVVVFLVVKRQDLFVERVPYWTVFADGEGLKVGSPVRIAGIEVGKINRVQLTAEDRVRVEFEILAAYTDRLVADLPGTDCSSSFDRPESCGSRLRSPSGLGLGTLFPGGGGLVVEVGQRSNPAIASGNFVPSVAEVGIMARLERAGVLEQLRAIVDETSLMLARLNNPDGPLWKSLGNLERVTAQAQSGQGVLGELMQPRSPLYSKVQASLDSLQKSMAQVESSTAHVEQVTGGVEQKMAQVQALIDNLEAFSKDARAAGQGLKRFADESEKVPPATREAIVNLNERIDDLGAILRGLKKTIPFGLAEDVKKKSSAP